MEWPQQDMIKYILCEPQDESELLVISCVTDSCEELVEIIFFSEATNTIYSKEENWNGSITWSKYEVR